MSEYIRFVSYMYQYDKGIKMSNMGFAKIDSRDTNVKITISIKDIVVTGMRYYEAFLIYRGGEQQKDKAVLLGPLEINDGTGELKLSSNEGGSAGEIDMSRAGAIVVVGRDKNSHTILRDIVYGTEWDDKLIAMDNIDFGTQLENADKRLQPINQPPVEEPVMPKAIMPDDKTLPDILEQDKQQENIIPDMKNSTYTDSIQGKTLELQSQEKLMDRGTEDYYHTYNRFMNSVPKASGNDDDCQKNSPDSERRSRIAENLYSQVMMSYPEMNPFEDEEIMASVHVTPYDVNLFPIDKWTYGSNSFILNGYHQYRHLIFAKVQSNQKNKGYYYMLGVPGLNYRKEQQLAEIYGFGNFKPIKDSSDVKGCFGYWYMIV